MDVVRVPEAMQWNERALGFAEDSGDPREIVQCLNGLAIGFSLRGHPRVATALLNLAADIGREHRLGFELSRTLLNMLAFGINYDLDAALGLEVITLQQFLPGVRSVLGDLGRVNQSYRKNLSSSKTATDQATALDGYSDAVARVVARFRRLGPPPALRPWQQAQVTRLQDVVDTGRNLAAALRVRDRNAVPVLIKRFRFLLSHQPNVSQAQHDAVKAYDNRLVSITKLQGKIAAEHQHLQNELG